jgi:hypothetical protein
LDLREHEHVLVSVVKLAPGQSNLAVENIENVKRELQRKRQRKRQGKRQDAEPAAGLEKVRKRLAKIPGSMALAPWLSCTTPRTARRLSIGSSMLPAMWSEFPA